MKGFSMRIIGVLLLAAVLEAGGDALVRYGLAGGRAIGFILGAAALFAYGVAVNLPRWDFGRLLGVYIALFFVVSQAIAAFGFHESIPASRLVGGALIVAGGIVMTIWK